MKNDLFVKLTSFGITLLVSLLVWNYYRRRTYVFIARYSTFSPRFWAGTVDSCVLWPISFITFGLLSVNIPKILAAILVVTESLAWLLYTVVLHGRYGQTVGKMTTKVRVVDCRTEGSISWRQAWIREGIPMVLSLGLLGYEVAAIVTGRIFPSDIVNGKAFGGGPIWLLVTLPSLWFVAEVVTMLTNNKRRALHDFIAGTVVIRTNAEEQIAQQSDGQDTRTGGTIQ